MAEQKHLFTEFKDFILRGNVLDLAVAVILATYFGQVIKDVVQLLLNVVAIFGKHTAFQNLSFHVRGGTFAYGQLIADIITFLIVAAAVFFVVVHPVTNMLEKRRAQGAQPDDTVRPCPFCLSEIPKAATRCSACTSEVPAAA
jgi:large conductance mechanosensitive channel